MEHGLNSRHHDKNGEISQKYGNTLVSTTRKIYGPSFAVDHEDDAKLSEVLADLHESSLTQLLKGSRSRTPQRQGPDRVAGLTIADRGRAMGKWE